MPDEKAALRAQDGEVRKGAGSSVSLLQDTASGGRSQGPAHGRVSGVVWTKAARGSAHQLRCPRAWALDLVDLRVVEQSGVRFVHVHDLESLRHYWASVTTIRRRGFALDRGAGQQLGLGVEWWRSSRQEAELLAGPARGELVQLPLEAAC